MRFAFAVSLLVAAAGATPQELPWRDPSGKPLPFETEAELLDFLRTARVVQEQDVGAGAERGEDVVLY